MLSQGVPMLLGGDELEELSLALNRMIDRLEAKGLISRSRCPEDRRLVKLDLTEAGEEALPSLRACSVRVLNRFLRGFTAAEARQLEEYLSRMLQNA